ncbi:glycine--tRNA ligase [Candidatus Micrarchaeota archaeon]|nr:glycine--tRNA ligase [Candidatus Micrarchaeota archaeon]MBI5176738.1 glycine--tRNA ligase [Candidatus Micrarchaeota archaeon]
MAKGKEERKGVDELSAKVINLAGRRFLIVPNSEIYGGAAGFYDFVGYGARIKRNVENAWWGRFVSGRDDVVPMEGSIITNPKVWRASGHLESFNDPAIDCAKCKSRFRADHLIEEELSLSVDGVTMERLEKMMRENKIACPKCGGALNLIKTFNLMFKTSIGAGEGSDAEAYLRPETAQVIFANFKAGLGAGRAGPPFGIAQVGKAFRNEISPRNFVFRMREFTQMELEYFVNPAKLDDCPSLSEAHLKLEIPLLTPEMHEKGQPAKKTAVGDALSHKTIGTKWHAYWLAECVMFIQSLGVRPENLRARKHSASELSHYSSETWDVEYNYPWGFRELMGVANRTDFDLRQHSAHSGKELTAFDEERKLKYAPHVFEPSFGVERLVFTILLDAYSESVQKEGSTVILKLSPKVAPLHAGVFPLMKKDGLAQKAREVEKALKAAGLDVEYDDAGSIGKRYARMDEVGVPLCITIDYDTLSNDTVTVRDRDTAAQVRVKISELAQKIRAGSA